MCFCSCHSSAGGTLPSQSTMEPSMENSSASKAPMQAVSVVIARISGRVPAVAAQMKGKKPCGGCAGGVSG
ncbi:hypothetical protein D3C78_1755670 [compost metagenome]